MNRIQFRRDLKTNWDSVNPILAEGEIGFETDTKNFKIGDGISNWSDLEYFLNNPNEINRILNISGISGYNKFSETKTYNIDDVVEYNNKLYKFTKDHVTKPWDPTDVIQWSLKDEIDYKFSRLEENITSLILKIK